MRIRLKNLATEANGGLSRAQGEQQLASLITELVELQELLFAARQTSVLIVLQGMDTSGKDGTIRLVMGPLNSQGCEVASFKVPTEKELAHDFLWRVHAQTPEKGQIKIFNRSHYEDVLVVRVLNLAAENVWRGRYDHIRHFEQLLADNGTVILKFYLHISKKEQEERLLAREQEPEKYWKLSVGDWQNRARWDDYMAAYEDALSKCSTKQAPWFIVPADKKWFRNLAVAETIVAALRPYKKQWLESLRKVGSKEKSLIEEYRGQQHQS